MPCPLLVNPLRILILGCLALATMVVADPAPETGKLRGWLATGGGGVILWRDYDFQGEGAPIVLPISLIARAEFLFRL
jgi:hypothetical protein